MTDARTLNQQGARYWVEPVGLWWHVRAGTGTRSLGRFLRRRNALRFASELTTAFFDGIYVASAGSDPT